MSIATGIGPNDLIEAPPGVLACIIRRIQEAEKKANAERHRARLRKA